MFLSPSCSSVSRVIFLLGTVVLVPFVLGVNGIGLRLTSTPLLATPNIFLQPSQTRTINIGQTTTNGPTTCTIGVQLDTPEIAAANGILTLSTQQITIPPGASTQTYTITLTFSLTPEPLYGIVGGSSADWWHRSLPFPVQLGFNFTGCDTFQPITQLPTITIIMVRQLVSQSSTRIGGLECTHPGYVDEYGWTSQFREPTGIYWDTVRYRIWLADTGNHAVRVYSVITQIAWTFAGTGSPGSSDGTATFASFNRPRGVVLAPSGNNLYVNDAGNCALRKINVNNGAVTTIGGRCGTNVTRQEFGEILAIALLAETDLFLLDGPSLAFPNHGAILKMRISDGAVTTIAGASDVLSVSSLDGTGSVARFALPVGMCVSPNKVFAYITEAGCAVRKVNLATGVVTTIFSGPCCTGALVDGASGTGCFRSPGQCIVEENAPFDKLWILDAAPLACAEVPSSSVAPYVCSASIRQLDLTTNTLTAFRVGGGAFSNADGTGTEVGLGSSEGNLAWAGGVGNLLVTDPFFATVRKVLIGTQTVTTELGLIHLPNGYVPPSTDAPVDQSTSFQMGSQDGLTSDARFTFPNSVTVAADGYKYFVSDAVSIRSISLLLGSSSTTLLKVNGITSIAADPVISTIIYAAYRHSIQRIDISGTSTMTLLAGSPAVAATVDGSGAAARMNFPTSLACDPSSTRIFFAETGFIRQVSSSTGVVSTVLGDGTNAFSLAGSGTSVSIGQPRSMVVYDGTMYIAITTPSNLAVIVAADLATFTPTLVQGLTSGTFTSGYATSCIYNKPMALTVQPGLGSRASTTVIPSINDLSGSGFTSLFVLDHPANPLTGATIARSTFGNWHCTAVGGGSGSRFSMGSAVYSDIGLNQPSSIAAHPTLPLLFVTDRLNHQVRTIQTGTGIISVYARQPNGSPIFHCLKGDTAVTVPVSVSLSFPASPFGGTVTIRGETTSGGLTWYTQPASTVGPPTEFVSTGFIVVAGTGNTIVRPMTFECPDTVASSNMRDRVWTTNLIHEYPWGPPASDIFPHEPQPSTFYIRTPSTAEIVSGLDQGMLAGTTAFLTVRLSSLPCVSTGGEVTLSIAFTSSNPERAPSFNSNPRTVYASTRAINPEADVSIVEPYLFNLTFTVPPANFSSGSTDSVIGYDILLVISGPSANQYLDPAPWDYELYGNCTMAYVFDGNTGSGALACPSVGQILEHGQKCQIDCNSGYSIAGAITTCDKGRLYQQQCRPAACLITGSGPLELGGCPMELPDGGECGMACSSGYSISTGPTRCTFGSAVLQSCTPYPCNFQAPSFGTLGTCTGFLSSGAPPCQFTCDSGYDLMGSGVYCNLGSISLQICTPKNCNSPPPTPSFSSAGTCAVASLGHAHECSISCNIGYELDQVSTKCAFGVYSVTQNCIPARCQVPVPTYGGQVVGHLNSCGTTIADSTGCTIACFGGYELVGGMTTCSFGLLSSQICQPQSCTIATPPSNGAWGTCTTTLPSEGQCVHYCNTGYESSAVSTTCSFGTLTQQVCTPKPCTTVQIYVPPHGSTGTCTGTVAHLGKCQFNCDSGWQTTHVTSNCTTGFFSPQGCQAIPCPISPPAYGTMGTCPNYLPSGSSCSFKCSPGYELNPSSPVTLCNRVAAPASQIILQTCDVAGCFLNTPTNGNMGDCPPKLPNGQSCSMGCDSGYQLVGSMTTCSAGTLTNQVCEPQGCVMSASNWDVLGSQGSCPGVGGVLASEATCSIDCAGRQLNGIMTRCYQGAFTDLQSCSGLPIPACPSLTLPAGSTWGSCTPASTNCAFGCIDSTNYEVSSSTYCSSGTLYYGTCRPKQCHWSTGTHTGTTYGTCFSVHHLSTCSIGCQTGYSLAGPTSMSCSYGVFDLPIQTCTPNPCTITAPVNGTLGTCSPTQSSGTQCQLGCKPGYSLDSSLGTNCTLGVVAAQKCLPSPCSVPIPSFGTRNTCGATQPSGTTCQISCAAGYVKIASSTNCTRGVLQAQTCEPQPCPLSAPNNGTLGSCVSPLASGSSCSYQCFSGYSLVAVPTLTSCLLGVLSNQICVPNPCDVFAPTNGQLGGCTPSIASNVACDFLCDSGYELAASPVKTQCIEGTLTSQTCVPKRCTISAPSHGSMNTCVTSMAHESTCTFDCQPGYTLTAPTTNCSFGVDTSQVCRPNNCNVVTPLNGTLGTCPTDLESGAAFACQFTCDSGYHLPASPTQTECLAGSLLTLQTCLEDTCTLILPSNAHANTCPGTMASGSDCQMSCDAGYLLRESGTSCYLGDLSSQWCDPLNCTLTLPWHGQWRNCSATLQHGTACSFSCLSGWHLVGGETRCELGVPILTQTCAPDPCLIRTPVNGSLYTCPSILPSGQNCQAACDPGFVLDASPSQTSCLAGTATVQTCYPLPCNVSLSLPPNSISSTCPDILHSGGSCQLGCGTGYTLTGAQTSCLASNLTLQSCEPSPCAGPTSVLNGELGNCSSATMLHGTVCAVQCHLGYLPATSGTLCQFGALQLQVCAPKPCQVVAPLHGTLGTCPNSGLLPVSAFCQMACDTNYRLDSEATLCFSPFLLAKQSCVWNLTTLEPTSCEVQPPLNGTLGSCGLHLADGGGCSFACNPRFELDPPSELTSCSNAILSPQRCIGKSCNMYIPYGASNGTCPIDVLASGVSCSLECEDGMELDPSIPMTICLQGALTLQRCRPSTSKPPTPIVIAVYHNITIQAPAGAVMLPGEFDDPCAAIVCHNGGYCVSHTNSTSVSVECLCAPPFFGPSCDSGLLYCVNCIVGWNSNDTLIQIVGTGLEYLYEVQVYHAHVPSFSFKSLAINEKNVKHTLSSWETQPHVQTLVQFQLVSFIAPPFAKSPRSQEEQEYLNLIQSQQDSTVPMHLSIDFAAASGVVEPSYEPLVMSFLYDSGGTTVSTSGVVAQTTVPTLLYYTNARCFEPGTFQIDGVCVECPEGCECPGGSRCLIQPGYYNDDELSAPIKCPYEDACTGYTGSPIEAQEGAAMCAAGYEGRACMICADSYYRLDGRCLPCDGSTSNTGRTIASLMAAVVVLFLLAISINVSTYIWLARIVLGFLLLQRVVVIGLNGSRDLPGSFDWVKAVFSVLAFTNFDLQFVSSSCSFPLMNYHTIFFGTILLMILAGVVFGVAVGLRYLRLSQKARLVYSIKSTDTIPAGPSRRFSVYQHRAKSTGGVSPSFMSLQQIQESIHQTNDPTPNGVTVQDMKPDGTTTTTVTTWITLTRRVSQISLRDASLAAQSVVNAKADLRQRFWAAMIVLACIFYLRMAMLAFRGLQCVSVPDPGQRSIDAPLTYSYYLHSDLSIRCFSGTHIFTVIVIALVLLLHLTFVPLYLFGLLCRCMVTGSWPGRLGEFVSRRPILQGDVWPLQVPTLQLLFDRESQFGLFLLGIRWSTFWYRLSEFPVSLSLALLIELTPHAGHLYIIVFVFALQCAALYILKPHQRARDDLKVAVIYLSLMTWCTLVLLVQRDSIRELYFSLLALLLLLLLLVLVALKRRWHHADVTLMLAYKKKTTTNKTKLAKEKPSNLGEEESESETETDVEESEEAADDEEPAVESKKPAPAPVHAEYDADFHEFSAMKPTIPGEAPEHGSGSVGVTVETLPSSESADAAAVDTASTIAASYFESQSAAPSNSHSWNLYEQYGAHLSIGNLADVQLPVNAESDSAGALKTRASHGWQLCEVLEETPTQLHLRAVEAADQSTTWMEKTSVQIQPARSVTSGPTVEEARAPAPTACKLLPREMTWQLLGPLIERIESPPPKLESVLEHPKDAPSSSTTSESPLADPSNNAVATSSTNVSRSSSAEARESPRPSPLASPSSRLSPRRVHLQESTFVSHQSMPAARAAVKNLLDATDQSASDELMPQPSDSEEGEVETEEVSELLLPHQTMPSPAMSTVNVKRASGRMPKSKFVRVASASMDSAASKSSAPALAPPSSPSKTVQRDGKLPLPSLIIDRKPTLPAVEANLPTPTNSSAPVSTPLNVDTASLAKSVLARLEARRYNVGAETQPTVVRAADLFRRLPAIRSIPHGRSLTLDTNSESSSVFQETATIKEHLSRATSTTTGSGYGPSLSPSPVPCASPSAKEKPVIKRQVSGFGSTVARKPGLF